MTFDELDALEELFNLRLPQVYRESIVGPSVKSRIEFEQDPRALSQLNAENRRVPPWGFDWQRSYWAIGEDGAGGFYFIDCENDSGDVFYLDHEDVADSLDEMLFDTLGSFLQELEASEKAFDEDVQNLIVRIRDRRWWEFWIPRSVPEWAKAHVQSS